MNQKRNEEKKHLIRKAEAFLQTALLTVFYYVIWLSCYQGVTFPYLGRGKYVLMGVYALLVMILFHYSDGFSYGHSKLADIIVSQCIAIFLVNFLTYWQLSLIANVMVAPVPMLLLTVLDIFLCLGCCYLYLSLIHISEPTRP